MLLAITDSGREFMWKAWDTHGEEDMEDAANILSIFEVHGPVIDTDRIYSLAYNDNYYWSEEPLNQDLVKRIVRRLFEARYLEQVQEYDEDNILMTMNPAAIPLEEAKDMHQKAKWSRMKEDYQRDKGTWCEKCQKYHSKDDYCPYCDD